MNPTIYEILPTDDIKIMHIVDNNKDPKSTLNLINMMGEKGTTLYGSHYRPGEVWSEQVFVCPKCVHATSEEVMEDTDQYHCKYCFTNWIKGTGVIEADGDFNAISEIK